MKKEFYDQKRWREIHRNADDLIATKDGVVLAALYRSPAERRREDYVRFVEMLKEWAATLPPGSVHPEEKSGPSG